MGLEWVWGLLRQVSPLLHKTTLTTVPIPKEHPSPHCVSLPNLVLYIERYERAKRSSAGNRTPRAVAARSFRWTKPPRAHRNSTTDLACRLSRSLKVTGAVTDRSATYDFLLVISNNHGNSLYRFNRLHSEIFAENCDFFLNARFFNTPLRDFYWNFETPD